MYVVVTGAPAAGKSTVSMALAPALGLPLLAKDTIKDALIDVLGAVDVEESRRLGKAAVAALLAVAVEARCGVLDSVWVDRDGAIAGLTALPGGIVEVFCHCDRDLLAERYAHRASSRGPEHFDRDRPETELWNPTSRRPLEGGWAVIDVDTTSTVDIDALAEATRGYARQFSADI